jgi:hypothetical protein
LGGPHEHDGGDELDALVGDPVRDELLVHGAEDGGEEIRLVLVGYEFDVFGGDVFAGRGFEPDAEEVLEAEAGGGIHGRDPVLLAVDGQEQGRVEEVVKLFEVSDFGHGGLQGLLFRGSKGGCIGGLCAPPLETARTGV